MTPSSSFAAERLAASPESADEALEPADAELQREVRRQLREDCRRKLEQCADNPLSAMTNQDVETYVEQGLSEAALEFATTEGQKTDALVRHQKDYIPAFIRQAERTAMEAMSLIHGALREGLITDDDAKEWLQKLKKPESTWLEKKHFIEKELPAWVEEWRALKKDQTTLEERENELGITDKDRADIKELQAVHGTDFARKTLKVPERHNLVQEAIAFLAARKKDAGSGKETGEQARLYAKARTQLEDAVRRKVLSPTKVGLWLRRIFESKANPDLIRKFLNGEGPTPLSTLINNWTEVKRRFDVIEKKRQTDGTPRSFHFVKIDVFLGWNYEKRKAYVEEADRRFTDIDKERHNFLLIRHALDTKDWDEAERLIRAEQHVVRNMTKEDQEKLVSMERFLKTHRTPQTENKEQKKPTDLEILTQMRDLMQLIPASQRPLHTACLRRSVGAFWVNKVAWYNRVWCREHYRTDDEIEEIKKQEAKERTADRIRHGHGLGAEANDVTGANNTQAAIRNQENLNAPQWGVANRDSAQTLAKKFDERQNSRNFWYWFNLLPEGVSYAEHEFIVKSVHPRMMRLAREMEKRGILYSDTGEVQYKRIASASRKTTAKTPGPSLALAP